MSHPGADKYEQYKKEQDLKTAMGPDSVVIGERPLHGHDEMYSNNWTHEHHLDDAHSNVFWTGPTDAKGNFKLYNLGFFDHDGVRPDSYFPDNISKYRFGPIYHDVSGTYNSSVMYHATHPAGFSAGTWHIWHNCQAYSPTVLRNLGLQPY